MNNIDRLGRIQAEIALLREEEAILKAKVKGEIFDSGEASLEGDLFRATLINTVRKVVDWRKIAMDLGATARKIRANTNESEVFSLRVTARSTAARRAA